MPLNLPGENLPAGDLARTINHESNDDWPTLLEIVAYHGKEGRKGTRKSITISSDQWFGRNGWNAPMTAEQLFMIIDRLRKGGQ